MIQEQTKGRTSRRRRRQQHQRDLPMIELQAITFLKVDDSLQAAGTMP
jgi:hypothetical protein